MAETWRKELHHKRGLAWLRFPGGVLGQSDANGYCSEFPEALVDAILADHASAQRVKGLEKALEQIHDGHHLTWAEYRVKWGLAEDASWPGPATIAEAALAALDALEGEETGK